MYRPEIEFILKASRFSLDEDEKSALIALSKQIDEDAMVDISRKQGTNVFIHKALYLNNLTEILSYKTKTILLKSHVRNMVKNEKKFACLQKLNDIIGEFVVLKGGQILQDVYDDTGIRLMSDLDILVPVERAIDTYEALRKFGFKNHEELSPGSYKSKKLIDLSLRHGYANHLPALDYGDLMVEIHCRLYGSDSDKISDEAYKSSLPKSEEEPHVRYLSPEYNIVFLCRHFYFHGSNRKFYQLIDIREFISKYKDQINWDKVDEIAKGTQLEEAISFTLNILNQHFGLDIEKRYISKTPIDIEEMLRNNVKKNKKEKVKSIFSRMKNPFIFVIVFFSEAFPSHKWLKRKYGKNSFKSYLIYLRNWFKDR